MKFLTSILLSQILYSYPGEFESTRPALAQLAQEGQLVSIKLVLGEPVKILVVGRERAQLNLSTLNLSVKESQNGTQNVLPVSKDGNFFLLTRQPKRPSDLEVTAEVQGKTETFKFRIDQKP
ncbi:MAG: hypothetical protein AB7H97_05620 [Pseudobdellovibrionaceae bacterium]